MAVYGVFILWPQALFGNLYFVRQKANSGRFWGMCVLPAHGPLLLEETRLAILFQVPLWSFQLVVYHLPAHGQAILGASKLGQDLYHPKTQNLSVYFGAWAQSAKCSIILFLKKRIKSILNIVLPFNIGGISPPMHHRKNPPNDTIVPSQEKSPPMAQQRGQNFQCIGGTGNRDQQPLRPSVSRMNASASSCEKSPGSRSVSGCHIFVVLP